MQITHLGNWNAVTIVLAAFAMPGSLVMMVAGAWNVVAMPVVMSMLMPVVPVMMPVSANAFTTGTIRSQEVEVSLELVSAVKARSQKAVVGCDIGGSIVRRRSSISWSWTQE